MGMIFYTKISENCFKSYFHLNIGIRQFADFVLQSDHSNPLIILLLPLSGVS
jgi:hypothetical protein